MDAADLIDGWSNRTSREDLDLDGCRAPADRLLGFLNGLSDARYPDDPAARLACRIDNLFLARGDDLLARVELSVLFFELDRDRYPALDGDTRERKHARRVALLALLADLGQPPGPDSGCRCRPSPARALLTLAGMPYRFAPPPVPLSD